MCFRCHCCQTCIFERVYKGIAFKGSWQINEDLSTTLKNKVISNFFQFMLQISFAVHLIPSPDWFVGVSNLDLCEGGTWRKDPIRLELQPWDAGTDGGFSFTSPDYVSNPQEAITQITAQFPDHPANSFFYPKEEALPPIAQVTMVWQEVDVNDWIRGLLPEVTQLGKEGRGSSSGELNGQMHQDSPEFVFPGMDLLQPANTGGYTIKLISNLSLFKVNSFVEN